MNLRFQGVPFPKQRPADEEARDKAAKQRSNANVYERSDPAASRRFESYLRSLKRVGTTIL